MKTFPQIFIILTVFFSPSCDPRSKSNESVDLISISEAIFSIKSGQTRSSVETKLVGFNGMRMAPTKYPKLFFYSWERQQTAVTVTIVFNRQDEVLDSVTSFEVVSSNRRFTVSKSHQPINSSLLSRLETSPVKALNSVPNARSIDELLQANILRQDQEKDLDKSKQNSNAKCH